MENNRILVIGIDGGTFDVILPMISRGELPVLASLMEKGSWGNLESTIPPDTGPAWVSMMTGVNPGKHGIYFFLGSLHNNLENGRTLGSADIKFPPLWSTLSNNDKKVIFVNVPFTYPPMEVNGVVISGMFVPNSAEVVSYPHTVYEDIKNILNGYEIDDWSPEVIGADKETLHLHYDAVIRGISLVTEKRKQATVMLLKDNPWDFAMVVFTSVDRLQHLFWKFVNADDDHGKKYSHVIRDGYRQVDSAIGEIIEKAGKDTTVIIVSDHGFGPLEKHFFVNKWLEEIGLLSIRKGSSHKRIQVGLTNLHRVLTKITGISRLPGWTKKVQVPVPRREAKDRSEIIAWERTRAYGNQCGININLRGREKYGVVEAGKEAKELLAFIQEQFYKLKDKADQQMKIPDWIVRKEEIYKGPYVEEAVDLYFSLKDMSYLQNARIDVQSIFDKSSIGSGMHRRHGIFIMSGKLCHKNHSIMPRIIDICPTILYLMELPVYEEMDGRVMEESIDPDYLKSHPVKVISAAQYGGKSSQYSQKDEEKIKESLKGLGYLS